MSHFGTFVSSSRLLANVWVTEYQRSTTVSCYSKNVTQKPCGWMSEEGVTASWCQDWMKAEPGVTNLREMWERLTGATASKAEARQHFKSGWVSGWRQRRLTSANDQTEPSSRRLGVSLTLLTTSEQLIYKIFSFLARHLSVSNSDFN